MRSIIVMTVIGEGRHKWPEACEALFPAPAGFCWRFVPEGSLGEQVRAVLRTGARAVVVWIGVGEAIDRAEQVVGRLLAVGVPVVIAIAEGHEPSVESVLRKMGAVYLCADEAEERLRGVVESILLRPSKGTRSAARRG